MNDILNRQLLSITGLVQLEKRIRHAETVEEFGFLVVNETHALMRYRQAILWRRTAASSEGKVLAVSGIALPDADAPFLVWLRKVLKAIGDSREIEPVDARQVPPGLAVEWVDWLPPHALWVPLDRSEDERLGGLLLVRDEPWTDHDRHLIGYLGDAYAHSWSALQKGRRDRGNWLFRRKGKLGFLVLALLAGLAWMPIRQSVLAPAEVIPKQPVLVRAPIDGVIDRVEVLPNQLVTEGQVLLTLDPARLQNRLDVARKAYEVGEAEYRQAAQQAVFDPRSKAQLAILQGRMEQSAAEVAYLESLLVRIEVKSPRNGIVIFDDVNDWIGKPVSIGERILVVADPQETELEIHVAVSDAIAVEEGNDVSLFLNVDPQNPIGGKLSFASYQANPTADGSLAYRMKADLGDAISETRPRPSGSA